MASALTQNDIEELVEIIRNSPVPLNGKAIRERFGRTLPANWSVRLKADPRIDWHKDDMTKYRYVGE